MMSVAYFNDRGYGYEPMIMVSARVNAGGTGNSHVDLIVISCLKLKKERKKKDNMRAREERMCDSQK